MGTIIGGAADGTVRGVCHSGVRVGDGGRREKGDMARGRSAGGSFCGGRHKVNGWAAE